MNTPKLTIPAIVLAATTSAGFAVAQEPTAEAPEPAPVAEAPAPAAAAPVEARTPVVATTAPATPLAAAEAPATGVMLQARLQSQSNLLSVGGGPGFLLGYRADRFALGLGFGLARIGGSSGNDSISGTLFQLVPTAMIDVWRSRDGRARANVVGGVGVGRGSLKAEYEYEDCVYDPTTGVDTCRQTTDESKASATFIPVMLGLGGDYFLSRNFALGVEGGLQAAFLAGAKTEESGLSEDVDAGGNMQFAYGVIRATMVFGN